MGSLEGGARSSSRPVRGVIFDLGGTLVYQNPIPELDRERQQCAAIARLAAEELGYRAPGALAERLLALRHEHGDLTQQDLVERRARDTIATGLREAGLIVNDGILDRAERLLFDTDRARLLYPGACELLETLRGRDMRIGLISNWSSHWIVTDVVVTAGIHDYFAPLVSSAGFGRVKPHPSIFLHVLEAWGLTPDDVIMIGDTLSTDILGALRVGMRSILVDVEPNPSNGAAEETIRPTHRVRDLLEIPPLLEHE
ncbi:MAG TPA: HAD family hydrolase [bacterium]|nr:HAD family hydrolase [bacterium]